MKISVKKTFFSLIFILLFIFYPLSINAADETLVIKGEGINPGSFYYSFKRIWEKGMDRLQFSTDSRVNFYQSQLKIRLSELNYVIENKLLGEVEQSSQRFAYSAGTLTNNLVKQNKSSEKEKVIKDFEKYSKFLEQLRDKYEANTSFWMLIQHDINSLGILADQIK